MQNAPMMKPLTEQLPFHALLVSIASIGAHYLQRQEQYSQLKFTCQGHIR